jgi:hypothetical protein
MSRGRNIKGGLSDVALCSDLAAFADNRFGRRALLRCGVIFYAINAPVGILESNEPPWLLAKSVWTTH